MRFWTSFVNLLTVPAQRGPPALRD